MQKEPSIFNSGLNTIPADRRNLSQQGFSLVEALLAVAIFGLGVTAFAGAIIYGQQATMTAGNRARAVAIAEEGLEAARNIRDADFANLVDGTYGLSTTGNIWNFTGSSSTVDIFTRTVQVQTVDTNRKRITSTVTWQQDPQRTGTVSLDTYLTYWQKSVGLWSTPQIAATFDLTTENSGNANANAVTLTFANNFVYLGRSNGAGSEFYIFNVSNPSSPQLVGRRDLNGTPTDIVVIDNYAFISSTDDASELQILDVSDPSTIGNAGKLNTFDLGSSSGSTNADAVSISLAGSNNLVMVRAGGNEFLVFDISNRTNPSLVGQTAAFTGTPYEVVANSSYSYVTSNDNAAEVQVFNIQTKTAPTRASVFNLDSGNGNADGTGIAFAGTHLLVGRASSGAPELYSLSLASPASLTLASTLELGTNVIRLSYDATLGYTFLITGDSNAEFKVLGITNLASLPALPALGSLNIANSPTDIVYDTTLNRAFISDSDDASEFIILQPQP